MPDFNADFAHDADDAGFLRGIDIPLDPEKQQAACQAGSKRAPEYLVAHGFLQPSDVDCGSDKNAVLLVGVGGGVANLRQREDAAGVRSMIDALQKAYDDRDIQTISIIAGPAIVGAENVHTAMEEWMTHAVTRLSRTLPVPARAPPRPQPWRDHRRRRRITPRRRAYASRIIQVVDVDRVETLYDGDTASRPRQVRVFNIYETNDAILPGAAYDAPNVANWDASGQMAPRDGQDGGPPIPANHTTIDNRSPCAMRLSGR